MSEELFGFGERFLKIIFEYRNSLIPLTGNDFKIHFYYSYKEKSHVVDRERVFPSEEVVTRKISQSQVKELIKIIKEASTPIMTDFVMGLDGVTFTLYIGNSSNGIEYTWWGSLPKGWEPIGKVIKYLLKIAKVKGIDIES